MRAHTILATLALLLAGCGVAAPPAGPVHPAQALETSRAGGLPITGDEARALQARIFAKLLDTSFRARGKAWYVLEEGEEDVVATFAYTKADRRVVRFAIDHLQASDGEEQGADVWVGGEYEPATGKLLKHRGRINAVTF